MHVVFAGMTTDNTINVRPHSHSHWEILYYFSGKGTLRVGNQDFSFQPGDILCQPPDIPHSEHSENGFYNIYMQVSDFKPPVKNTTMKFRDTSNLDIHNICMFLYREFHLKNHGWNFLCDELFQVLYRYILSMNPDTLKNSYVKELEEILVSNISNPGFTIEDAEKNIPLSSFYLKRLFKKETGRSPLEYLTEKRIDYSKQLLETKYETSMTVKEIAGLAGYDDPYYFSRVFKKVTGKCPTEWVSSITPPYPYSNIVT